MISYFGNARDVVKYRMQVRIGVLPFLLLALGSVHADESTDLQERLQEKFMKKVMVIRHFYSGDHLVFDSHGNLISGEKAGGYDGCRCIAELEIRHAEIKDNKLVLSGPRIVGDESGAKKEFASFSRGHTQVQIDVELDPAQMNEETITGTLNKVFLTSDDDMKALAPMAWVSTDSAVTARGAGKTNSTPIELKGMNRTPNGVTPPKVIQAPDPEYTEEARSARIEGDVILWIIIDPKGSVRGIKITRCVGYGLDESAVQAVSRWKFEPAKKDGQPVTVQLNVDVVFHLQ